MEAVIDIRLALEHIRESQQSTGPGLQFGGSVTAGTENAWNAVTWENAHPKPSWADLCVAHAAAVTENLYASLRAARDERLSDTDKCMLADYPVSADSLAAVKAYRAALRDLPDAPGAPWDGGGEATLWPDAPAIVQTEQPCA